MVHDQLPHTGLGVNLSMGGFAQIETSVIECPVARLRYIQC